MLKKLIPILFLFAGFQANAAIIDIIDQGDTTYDSISGLEWLDMRYTDGISYADALAQSSGFVGGGWRNASYAEVQELAVNAAGMTIDSILGYHSGTELALTHLVELFGNTFGWPTAGFVVGNVDIGGGIDRVQFGFFDDDDLGYFRNNDSNNTWDSYPEPDQRIGTFLVRAAAVPEPSIIALFGLGLVGLGFARRRRQS